MPLRAARVEGFEAAVLVQHVDDEAPDAEELDDRLRPEAHLLHRPRGVLDGDCQPRAGRHEGGHALAHRGLVALDVDLLTALAIPRWRTNPSRLSSGTVDR